MEADWVATLVAKWRLQAKSQQRSSRAYRGCLKDRRAQILRLGILLEECAQELETAYANATASLQPSSPARTGADRQPLGTSAQHQERGVEEVAGKPAEKGTALP